MQLATELFRKGAAQAKPHVHEALARAREFASDIVKGVHYRYRTYPRIRATVDASALLLLVTVIDQLLGYPLAWRTAYLAPVVVATQRGDWRSGLAFVVLVSWVATALDPKVLTTLPPLPILNFGLRLIVFGSVALLVDSVRRRIRTSDERAQTDGLTGALNRTALYEVGRRLVQRSLIGRQPLTVVMVDCDHFKELNDHFGHAFGDQVLRMLVRVLHGIADDPAVTGRTGGDEFVLVLPGWTPERVAEAMVHAGRRYGDATLVMGHRTSFSYGLACTRDFGFSFERLLEAADEHMYRQKLSGRLATAI